jgi:UDP-N-acetyl-D-mannosaminuronic acid dehydrogenase
MAEFTYDVCIVGGLGHVGLPLGISLADAGKTVALYDINAAAAEAVRAGEMPFLESGAEPVLRKVLGKTLSVTTDRQAIGRSRFVVIVIGTPVDEHLNPVLSIFREFFDGIVDLISDDQHVVLRSTVFPGITAWTRSYLEAHGKRPALSFCPERISQGQAMEELRTLPQIVAAFEPAHADQAAELFARLTGEIIRLDPMEAELAKLFNNVWRYIQFAIANQFYQIADRHGLDFYRIHDALTHNYPRAGALPKAGFAAGPCLFKDTMQLAAFSDNSFFLGHAAMLVNEGLPNHIVSMLRSRYDRAGGLKEATAGILGMAFKANNDDKRQSLSYKLRKLLEIETAEVLCSDVYIHEPAFVSTKELVRRSDVIVLGTPHKEYADIKIPAGKLVVDVWNFLAPAGGKENRR